jgi:hypothetical protein
VALKVAVVNATLRENIGNSVAHRLADAQLTLRAAGRRIFLLVVAWHLVVPKPSCPRSFAGIYVFLFNQVRRGWPEQIRP